MGPALQNIAYSHRAGRGVRPYKAVQERGIGVDCHASDVGHWFAMAGGYKGIMRIWAAGCGHPALPEKQRIAQLEWASTSAERVSDVDAEAM